MNWFEEEDVGRKEGGEGMVMRGESGLSFGFDGGWYMHRWDMRDKLV